MKQGEVTGILSCPNVTGGFLTMTETTSNSRGAKPSRLGSQHQTADRPIKAVKLETFEKFLGLRDRIFTESSGLIADRYKE